MATTKQRVTRATQKTNVIYVTPSGTAFVTPDGEGRYFYDRRSPEDYGYELAIPDGLLDVEAAVFVAKDQHGDLPVVYLEEDVND